MADRRDTNPCHSAAPGRDFKIHLFRSSPRSASSSTAASTKTLCGIDVGDTGALNFAWRHEVCKRCAPASVPNDQLPFYCKNYEDRDKGAPADKSGAF